LHDADQVLAFSQKYRVHKEVIVMLSKAWSSGWLSLNELRREMDTLFDHFFSEAGYQQPSSPLIAAPQVETFLRDNQWVMRLDLPGVEPKDINVSITGDRLTIAATREWHNEGSEHQQSGNDTAQQIRYGKFERSFNLPKGAKTDQLKASYRHGVLELTIPAAAELAGRRIPVELGTMEEKPQLENKAA
jgi:HSP20 family protein